MAEAPWARAFASMMAFKGALASVALSHPAECSCEVCRAASGDEDAFGRLYVQSRERRPQTNTGEGTNDG